MYKSQIFQLCRRNNWDQPVFSAVKLGPDHGPTFMATVTINGTSFHAPDGSRSTKLAQNKAAKVAFDHLSTSSSTTQITNPNPDANPNPDPNPNPNLNPPSPPPQVPEQALPVLSRLPIDGHGFKNILRDYTQRKRIPYPQYSTEHTTDSSQARCFRSKVVVGEETYESPSYYLKEKEAENAAASVACEMLMKKDDILKAENSLYKSLLFEWALKRRLQPKFETRLHLNRFTSSVKIGEKIFEGHPSATKKLADHSAAKVAYIAIKQDESANQKKGSSLISPVQDNQQLTKTIASSYSDSTKESNLIPNLDNQGLTKTIPSSNSGSTKESNLNPILDNQQLIKTIPSPNSGNLPDKKTNLGSQQLKKVMPPPLKAPIKSTCDQSLASVLELSGCSIEDALQESLYVLSCALSGEFFTYNKPDVTEETVTMDVDESKDEGTAMACEFNTMGEDLPEVRNLSVKHDLLEKPDPVARLKRAKLGEDNKKPWIEPFLELKLQEGETVTLSCDKLAIYPRVPNLAFPDDDSVTILPFHNDKWVAVGMMKKK